MKGMNFDWVIESCTDNFFTDEDVTVMLDYEGQQEYILCHLSKMHKQESLDLNLQAGDTISLFTQGSSTVHLSGYLGLHSL